MTKTTNWFTIDVNKASEFLFFRCVEFMLKDEGYLISSDVTIRILTQRIYGDYRLIGTTAEYKRAEKHVKLFKNTGLGKLLF